MTIIAFSMLAAQLSILKLHYWVTVAATYAAECYDLADPSLSGSAWLRYEAEVHGILAIYDLCDMYIYLSAAGCALQLCCLRGIP